MAYPFSDNEIPFLKNYSPKQDNTGIIGGYCEDGFPFYYANEQMAALLGYSSVEELKEGIHGLVANTIHPDDMEQVKKDLGDHFYEGMTYETAYRMPKRNGSWFFTLDKGQVIKTEDGRLAIVSQCTDIREFVRQQKELEKREQELKEILASVRLQNEIISAISTLYAQIFIIDLEKQVYHTVTSIGTQHTIDRETGTLSHMYRIAMEHLVVKEHHSLISEFLNFDTLADRLHDQPYLSTELLGTDGKWYSLCFIPKKRNEQGILTHVLYTIQDITDTKKQELDYKAQLLRSMEEARQANIAKTNFLRHMSHDIRTPINGIMGMIRIADRYAGNKEKLQECRQKTIQATDYLLSIVNNILDMGKVESDGIILEHKSFDLIDLLFNDYSVIEMQANTNGIHFHGEAQQSAIPHHRIMGSPVHVSRCLMNLASNAIKYNRKDGSIMITCRELAFNGTTATYEFVCTDTGIGMSEEFAAHAFEPFTQEGKEPLTTYIGSGLGLSIVHYMVQKMNGTIDLKSRENEGTTITLTIPFTVLPEDNAASAELAEPVDLCGKRALLVEDNPLNREIAQIILEDEGLLVTTAENGQEALDVFTESAPYTFDFIFMDIMMPVMNGLEATRQIRAICRPDAQSIPILAMTANAFEDDKQSSLLAGMNAHLLKPLDVEKLREAIQQVSHIKRTQEENV